ncbi:unnamed protein product, partial [Rotaria socialis]
MQPSRIYTSLFRPTVRRVTKAEINGVGNSNQPNKSLVSLHRTSNQTLIPDQNPIRKLSNNIQQSQNNSLIPNLQQRQQRPQRQLQQLQQRLRQKQQRLQHQLQQHQLLQHQLLQQQLLQQRQRQRRQPQPQQPPPQQQLLLLAPLLQQQR